MKILKILLILLFLFTQFVITEAKEQKITPNKLEYINIDWWNKFSDEQLKDYLIFAFENNKDLKIATAATNQAQQVVKMAFADQLPQLSLSANISREFTSSTTRFGDVIIPDYSQSRNTD